MFDLNPTLCMKKLLFSLLILHSSFALAQIDHVNPLVGSLSKIELSTGNTYPATAMPWGMNFWTPQTGKMGHGWTYVYTADKIRGLKQTHQPSPWINDYGQFSLMPTTGRRLFDQDKRASWFSHKSEVAKPHYYSVYLADHDVTAELTPTERACFFRFTFPENESSNVIVDAFDRGSWVEVRPDQRRVVGYSVRNSGGVPDNFKNWFVVEFDRDFDFSEIVAEENGHAGAIVSFKTREGEVVHARVASSFISLEQAERNLDELGSSFDETFDRGKKRWNEVLGRIEVEGDVDDIRTFYSCLYRSVLFPRDLSEIDENGNRVHYSPFDGQVHKGEMFTDTGFWDTFRSLFPLINLLYPEMAARMQAGLVNTWLESGFLPEWASPGHRNCMVGNNSASVVADAYLKGIRGQDIEELWKAVVHGANAAHPKVGSTGRRGWEEYNTLGYVPYDTGINESAARTLEYAYDDWCIYQLGKALGKPESEIGIYAERAMNYRNLYDGESGLMRGRNGDGSWQSPFSPYKWGDAFTEGNSLHYTWSVFHDPAGLIELMGGRDGFNDRMDSVFELPPIFDDSYYGGTIHEIREMQIMDMGNYAHGNQPIQHMIYLYDWSGEPWKTQKWVREVMERLYSATPDGYCGDEDNGQTSAWYVFSALGFYPVCPGSGEYALGSPLFSKAVMHLPEGDVAINSEGDGVYVDELRIDGKRYGKNFLRHSDMVDGVRLNFTMSDVPNMTRGTAASDAPYSFSCLTKN